MKFKDLLIPLILSIITVAGVQYFFLRTNKQEESTQPRPGQGFTAPTQQEITKPLQTSLTFAPHEDAAAIKTDIITDYGFLVFTTHTGSLEQLTFKRIISGKERVLTPLSSTAQENRNGFIVALGDATPFVYTLTDKEETKENTKLTYKAEGSSAIITKQFIVDHTLPKIDLKITIEPKTEVQARIFLPAPYMAQTDQDYKATGIVYTERQRIQKQQLSQLGNQFWFAPSLFGAEDRYFVHALISDPQDFTRRAYYTGTTLETLTCILEGPQVTESRSWTLSFYCGPKDAHIMDDVDSRLEATLDYGWLSPLVKLLLAILKFLYDYVKNYGWAIILLTLLIRLLMLPVTYKSHKALEKQKEFQRKMQYIEQKHKNDPEALNRERMELTRKYGMSNMLGCLPQLAQLPILLALNRLLSTSVELYQAPFMGWITDLSARDPYYILPVLAGVGLLLQVTTESDMRRGMTMMLFAALLVAITAYLSAGLTLYLCANTWLSIAQTYAQKALKK